MKDAVILLLVMSLFFGAMYFYAYMEAKRDKKKNSKTRGN